MATTIFRSIKIISITAVFACFILLTINQTVAANLKDMGDLATNVAVGAKLIDTGSQPKELEQIIGTVITAVLGVFGAVYLAFIIVAGVWWQTAHGEKDKVEKAKEMIKDASIGLAVILGGYALTYFIVNAVLTSGALKSYD